mmetsp:Transcript_68681/g.128133  ORF Transcript_68681/g.128133 Transcript_68681/m.128133 type:complete len:234 (-) Transcript_68681:187-888(-)
MPKRAAPDLHPKEAKLRAAHKDPLGKAAILAESNTLCFNVAALSGASAAIECSDKATVLELQDMVRERLSIGDVPLIRLVADSHVLEPATAALKDVSALLGSKTKGLPVELTMLAEKLKVKRHMYSDRGQLFGPFHLVATDETVLSCCKKLHRQKQNVFPAAWSTVQLAYQDLRREVTRVTTMPANKEPPSEWYIDLSSETNMQEIAEDIFGSGDVALVVYLHTGWISLKGIL